MRICVFGASSSALDPVYLEAGERLGRELRRSRGAGEYERLEGRILAELPLGDHPEGELV